MVYKSEDLSSSLVSATDLLYNGGQATHLLQTSSAYWLQKQSNINSLFEKEVIINWESPLKNIFSF